MWRRAACRAFLLVLALSCAASATAADGLIVWTPDTGQVDIEKLPRETPLQRFAYARALAGAGQYGDAVRELTALVKAYPDEMFVEQAEEAIIVCRWQQGKHRAAYKACWNFLRNYPGSVLVPEIERMRMQIAIDLSRRSPKAAIRLFEELLETSKFAEQSAEALRYLGDCNVALKRYQEARDRYKELVEDYPKSQWLSYAFYRMGYCDFKDTFRQMRDMGLMRRAMTELKEYQEEYEKTSPRPAIKRHLAKLEAFDAQYHLEVARFYERKKHKPDAATIYYARVVELYPDSTAAATARERLKDLTPRFVTRPEQVGREVPF